ncbi:MAG: YkgJ family cysteine cluster protein [Dokdonella sp.]
MIDEFDIDAADIDPSVHCADCEAVCCRLTALLMPDDAVPAWLTTHDEHGLEQMAKGDDGWCIALDRDSLRCTIYPQRPEVCRSYDMGGAFCRDERAGWYGNSAAGIPIRVVNGVG